MNLKLIGGICIVVSCGSVGFITAATYRRTVRQLREITTILREMICELQYHATPLPQLCRQASHRAQGILKQVFSALATEIENQEASNVSQCMGTVLETFSGLPRSVYGMLEELGKNLGKFDVSGQILVLEGTHHMCCEELDALLTNQDGKLRSYQTLGLCAGAALAILFV